MIKYVAVALIGALAGFGASKVFTQPVETVETQDVSIASEVIVQKQAPAYMLVLGEVKDRAAFGVGYAAKLPPLYEKFGGHYIAIGGGTEVLEGDYAPPSYVIGKWPSKEAAHAFWNSPEYEELKRARIDNGWGDFDVLLVQGVEEAITVSPMVNE